MHVVIFRAKIRTLDAEYVRVASRLRELAFSDFGCLAFHATTEGDHEIAVSYWPDPQSILAWKQHPEHRHAQELGREKWYDSYSVEIAEISRDYRWNSREAG